MEQAYLQRRWAEVLKHRWPTVLGIAVAVLTAFDLQADAGFVSSISAVSSCWTIRRPRARPRRIPEPKGITPRLLGAYSIRVSL